MSFSGRVVTMVMGAALCGVVGVSGAFAQTCGDADGSGSVTVTDGVQVLRSAAGLSSGCSERTNSCDVDGSGSVTITDGVNVLRKAAGVSITESCPGGGGDGTADVAQVTDVLLPFLTFGLREVPSVSDASAAVQPADTQDCEDGGTRTTSRSGSTFSVTFAACKVSESGVGSAQLDGLIRVELGIPNSGVDFDLKVTDLETNKLYDFHGELTGQVRLSGGFVLDGGPVSVLNGAEGPKIFEITFNDLTVDGNGHIESGSVEAEDTSDSFELQSAEVEVEDGSSTASVHVVRDDQTEQDYTLNLNTGDLTPVN
jgi:hypothetical protein